MTTTVTITAAVPGHSEYQIGRGYDLDDSTASTYALAGYVRIGAPTDFAVYGDETPTFGTKPIYIVGDSNMAVSNREVDFSTATVVNNTFQWAAANINVPPGTMVRTYGFDDPRFNFMGTMQYVGGLPTLTIPSPDIPNQALPALGTGMTLRRAQVSSAWGDRGFPFWVHGTTGRKFRWFNRARSGSDTRAHLANIKTDLAGDPGIALIVGTMNDALQGFAESLTESNYRAMVTAAVLMGHEAIIVPNTTFGTAQAGYLAYNKRQLRQAKFLRDLALEFKLDVLDAGDLQMDKTSAEATPTTGLVQADAVHWTPKFFQVLAPYLVTLLDRKGAASSPIQLMGNALDSRYSAAGTAITGNETNNIISKNGQFVGTGSTVVTGGPDLMTFAKNANVTLTLSKVAGVMSATSKMTATMSSTGSGQDWTFTMPTVHADAAAGKKVTVSCRFDTTTNINYFMGFGALLTFTGAGTDQPIQVYTTDVASPGNAMPTGTYSLVLSTPEFEIPAGYTLTNARPYAQVSSRAAMTTQPFNFEQVTVSIR